MAYDFEDVNRVLAELAEQNMVEPMVEPIDEDDCHPLDYAEVTGLFDEMYPEPKTYVDSEGFVWYTH